MTPGQFAAAELGTILMGTFFAIPSNVSAPCASVGCINHTSPPLPQEKQITPLITACLCSFGLWEVVSRSTEGEGGGARLLWQRTRATQVREEVSASPGGTAGQSEEVTVWRSAALGILCTSK